MQSPREGHKGKIENQGTRATTLAQPVTGRKKNSGTKIKALGSASWDKEKGAIG